jgi:predicted enzyme related to lactoylglutathione lyase
MEALMRMTVNPQRTGPMGGKRQQQRALGVLCGVGLGLAGATCAVTGRTLAADLPPLVPQAAPAGPVRLPGKMVFAALVTPDLVGAEKFYTDLFRWQFQNANVGGRLIGQASFNGRTVAVIAQLPLQKGAMPAWRSFLSTGDVDGSLALAVQHGATLLVKPHDLANIGRDALLADPQGAVFGLLTSSSGDPADVATAPGEWIWSTLVTSDPIADAAFYKTVFGYQTYDAADPSERGHITLASADFARASVNPMPSDHPVLHPRWISYVRVSDLTAMVARATALGAHVVVPPHNDPHGGGVSLIADPAGALFGLLEWQDDPAPGAATAGDAK